MTEREVDTSAGNRTGLVRWTGWGFIIGSALFAIGVPLSLPSSINLAISAWTYFLGSIFFTTAGTLQLVMSGQDIRHERRLSNRWNAWWGAKGADVVASFVQWIGTIAFNVTTLRGALDASDRASIDPQVVWAPDAIGSVLFLVSSAIALAPEVRARRHGHARDRSWAIAALNMVGSIFFGLSAVGAYTLKSTDELLSVAWSNWGTFLGAICFLWGAALLLPRRGERATATDAATSS